jgi:hypothetical protein
MIDNPIRIPWPSGAPCTPSCRDHGSCWRLEARLAPEVGCDDDDYGCEVCGRSRDDDDCWCSFDESDDNPTDSEIEEWLIDQQIAAAEDPEPTDAEIEEWEIDQQIAAAERGEPYQ